MSAFGGVTTQEARRGPGTARGVVGYRNGPVRASEAAGKAGNGVV